MIQPYSFLCIVSTIPGTLLLDFANRRIEREAMFIQFKATSPFKIAIYAEGINVVTGDSLPSKQNADGTSLQDYVIVPKQKAIFGVTASPGFANQFVAAPPQSR